MLEKWSVWSISSRQKARQSKKEEGAKCKMKKKIAPLCRLHLRLTGWNSYFLFCSQSLFAICPALLRLVKTGVELPYISLLKNEFPLSKIKSLAYPKSLAFSSRFTELINFLSRFAQIISSMQMPMACLIIVLPGFLNEIQTEQPASGQTIQ